MWQALVLLTGALILLSIIHVMLAAKIIDTGPANTRGRKFAPQFPLPLSRLPTAAWDHKSGVPTYAIPSRWLEENNLEELKRSAVKSATYRKEVVEMIKFAWDGYEAEAFGKDRYMPMAHSGVDWMGMGNFLIDSMSTLYLAGLHEEFSRAAEWVKAHFTTFDTCHGHQSFFETTIRVLGGLISASALSGDAELLSVSQQIGERYLMSLGFHGMDHAMIRNVSLSDPRALPKEGIDLCRNSSNQRPGSLAQVGSFQLEFRALSLLTGDLRYKEVADLASRTIEDRLHRAVPGASLPGRGIANGLLSLGAESDSYIEYLLKQWLQTGRLETHWKQQWRAVMEEAIYWLVEVAGDGDSEVVIIPSKQIVKSRSAVCREGVTNPVVSHLEANSLLAVKDMVDTFKTRLVNVTMASSASPATRDPNLQMEHLTCFVGGMMELAYHSYPVDEREVLWKVLAEETAATCYRMYLTDGQAKVGLGPESVGFDTSGKLVRKDHSYILRPETLETFYYLHYFRGNPDLVDSGAELMRAIDRIARDESAYHGIDNRTRVERPQEMESFVMAETFKYLLLLFSSPDLLPLEEWVFNTEGHPLPVAKWLPKEWI